MFDQEDDAMRVGVVTALGVTVLVLFGLLGGLVVRQIGGKTPGDGASAMSAPASAADGASAPAGGPLANVDAAGEADPSGITMVDEPLAGEVVGVLYFGVGSASLPPEAEAQLEKAKAAMVAKPGKRIMLSGFHDASGNAGQNAELAKRRAIAARSALVAAGVDAAAIALRKPDVTTGDGPPEQARRVEIRLVD